METLPTLIQCRTCGVERDAAPLPEVCPVCADDRQYVLPSGQRWVSAAEAAASGATLTLVEREPGIWGIDLHDGWGIGQQAKLAVTGAGNVLVDVPAHITPDAVARVRELGGLAAIVPSHPHMYGVQSAWSRAFDDAPVWVARADEAWLGRRPAGLRLFTGEVEVVPGVRVRQVGGHFRGSSVVHLVARDGRGVLLSGDTFAPTPDPGWLKFMRSYPNAVPLSGAVARRIAADVADLDVDRVYGNFTDAVAAGGAEAIQRSARRHAAWAAGLWDGDTTTDPGARQGARLRLELFPADLAASVAFYIGVLGFAVVQDDRADDPPYVGLRRGGIDLGLLQRPEGAASGVELVLEVPDVVAERDAVTAAGWSLAADLAARPWGLTDFRLHDPDGHYWRVTDSFLTR